MNVSKYYLLFLIAVSIIACGKQQSISSIPSDYRLRSGDSELTFQQQIYYIAAALEIYRLHTGSYPTQEENLEALLTKPDSVTEENKWFGPYADSELFFTDPWNNRIVYTVQPNEVFDLRSYGKDGIKSGDDIIARDLMPDLFRELDKLAGQEPLQPNFAPDDNSNSDGNGEN